MGNTRDVATYCYQCVAGPDLMRVEDGVATEINPDFKAAEVHPAGGKICVKAYGLIQKTYNPHRILTPMKRTNPRKGRKEDPGFTPISWDEALDTIAGQLNAARAKGLTDDSGYPRLAASFGGGGTPTAYMGTLPLVQWRRVLDIESGEYPNVSRTFVPVGCMHCADPPCMHVCPSTATRQRDDGIVTIDYDLCIGCSFCAVACPYQARYRVDTLLFAYGASETRNEAAREDPQRLGVDALHFGDTDDPTSNISQLLRENRHFRMHEELGTDPGFHYLWDGTRDQLNEATGAPDEEPAALESETDVNMPGVAPWRQTHWDWRAAGNFVLGGAGGGLLVMLAATAFSAPPAPGATLLALGFIGLGLNLVWLEIGRPWRFLHVVFNPHTSWMTREALAALLVFAAGLATLLLAIPGLAVLTGLFALLFVYCQARILLQSKGVPLWREPRIVPVILATGLTEGCGLLLAGAAVFLVPLTPVAVVLLLLAAARAFAWRRYRGALTASGAPDWAAALYALAGLSALAAGWVFKVTLVTTAAYNQGFALERTPSRGAGAAGPGIKPGWR